MLISLQWLRDYVDVDVNADTLAEHLTLLGLEIESVSRPGDEIKGVRVGQIESVKPHPNADKLVVCRTTVGEGDPLQIVCGATNMKEGDKVPTACVGAVLPGGFEIGRRKMRGEESQGMMCSGRELGISEDHAGLLVLPGDAPVGEDVVRYLGLDDVVFEIEVTPNRNDWASMIGVARELATLYGKELRIPEVHCPESGTPAAERSSVEIQAPEHCARYAGRVLTGVTVGPSPDWLRKRLLAAGQRPINNIVDITNYVLLETGHPLHAFDFERLAENRIVVRTARADETLVTIDDENRALNSDMLVIADAERPVALAGIMGGSDSEVSAATRTVFLESAWFDPISIRRTARRLGMTTEASQRFQRGADPEMVAYALDRAAALMGELAGAEIAPGVLDEYPAPPARQAVTLRHARVDAVLGTNVREDEQRAYLERLGFMPDGGGEGTTVFAIPTWRHDCRLEEDLIEEVARFHGYDNVPARMPAVRQNGQVFAPQEQRLREVRNHLVAQGLTEIVTMSFGSPSAHEASGIDPRDMVALQNPLAETAAGMRTSLVPNVLATVRDNINRGAHDLKLFEVGPIYRQSNEGSLPAQETHLVVAMTGRREPSHWSNGEAPAVDVYDVKGVAEMLLEGFRLSATFETRNAGQTFDPDVCAEIARNGEPIGVMGRVSAAVCNSLDIERDIYMLSMNLHDILEAPSSPVQFTPVAPYPPSLRDLAVVVAADVPGGEVLRLATEAGGKYLKRVQLFDVYEGDQVAPGKKSMAISLVFQSAEQTLSDKVTQKASDAILRKLREQVGAELR